MSKKNRKNNEKKIRTVHVERITDKDVNNINKVINRTQDKKENEGEGKRKKRKKDKTDGNISICKKDWRLLRKNTDIL